MVDFEEMHVTVRMKKGEEKVFYRVIDIDRENGWVFIHHTVVGFPDSRQELMDIIPESQIVSITVKEAQQ